MGDAGSIEARPLRRISSAGLALVVVLGWLHPTVLHGEVPEEPDPREVTRVRFKFQKDRFSFDPPITPYAELYNVYKKVTRSMPVKDMGSCVYDRIGGSCNGYTLPGEPEPGELWLIQVTAVYQDGEGPMGHGRRPAAPCVCGLPPDPGPCDERIPRWYRTYYGLECRQFTWSGCGGNANNFETEEACRAACLDTCVLPPHPSNCCGAFRMYFYSPDTGQCEEFVSGGCVGPPANAFVTLEDCEATCPRGDDSATAASP